MRAALGPNLAMAGVHTCSDFAVIGCEHSGDGLPNVIRGEGPVSGSDGDVSEPGRTPAAWQALGRQLAACRKAAGLSQERLAVQASYSRSSIANVETGRQRVGPEFWVRCDEILRAGGVLCQAFAEAEAVARSDREQAVAAARYESLSVALDECGRTGDATGVLPPAGACPVLVALEAGTARDPQVVADLAGALAGQAQLAAMFGGADLLPMVVRQVRYLHGGFDSTRGPGRVRLVGVAARFAEFAGWLCQDLDRRGDALFWSDRALQWAREADDIEFVSYVLMRHSDLAEGHEPARRVLDLATAAERAASLGPRAQALAFQQQAVGLALGGDVAGFERAVERAADRLDAAAGSDDAPWGLYCTTAYVAMQEATGWMQLGDPGRAVMVFEREIGRLPASDRVDGSVYRARLARAYGLNGDIGQAGRVALAAWELAVTTRSQRAWRELSEVRRAIGREMRTAEAARFAAAFDAHARLVGARA
jgi:DNA-binding XRE family transcriptional regulator